MVSIVTISEYFVAVEMVNKNWTTFCVIKVIHCNVQYTCILYQCIQNLTFLDNKPLYIQTHLTPVSNDTFPVDSQGNGQFEGDTFIGTINMGALPDKKKWLISFSLLYNSGLYINVSQPTIIIQ